MVVAIVPGMNATIKKSDVLSALARIALADATARTGAPRPGRALVWTERDVWLGLALEEARGEYQRALVKGQRLVSCNDLRGRAKDWRNRYLASTAALLARLDAAKIPYHISNGRLVVGSYGSYISRTVVCEPDDVVMCRASIRWSDWWQGGYRGGEECAS